MREEAATEIEKLVERLRATARAGRVQDWRSDRDNDAWAAASEIERLLAALKGAEGEAQRRGVKIIEMVEIAGAHLCRAEKAEAERDRIGALYDQEDKKAAADIARLEAERDAAVAALKTLSLLQPDKMPDPRKTYSTAEGSAYSAGYNAAMAEVAAIARAALASNSGGG